jgi:hypothetical protein
MNYPVNATALTVYNVEWSQQHTMWWEGVIVRKPRNVHFHFAEVLTSFNFERSQQQHIMWWTKLPVRKSRHNYYRWHICCQCDNTYILHCWKESTAQCHDSSIYHATLLTYYVVERGVNMSRLLSISTSLCNKTYTLCCWLIKWLVRCPCHNHVDHATILTVFDVEKESTAQDVMSGSMPQHFVVQVRERHLVF